MMYVNPYAVGAQGIPMVSPNVQPGTAGYGIPVQQSHDQQQLMAAYALQQQQYMLQSQAQGQIAGHQYAGYGANVAALQQYQQVYQSQMPNQGAQDNSSKDAAALAQQSALAYGYAAHPYYMQQQIASQPVINTLSATLPGQDTWGISDTNLMGKRANPDEHYSDSYGDGYDVTKKDLKDN